jgi:hypothetical protein
MSSAGDFKKHPPINMQSNKLISRALAKALASQPASQLTISPELLDVKER